MYIVDFHNRFLRYFSRSLQDLYAFVVALPCFSIPTGQYACIELAVSDFLFDFYT